jgi:hypothetical protein
MQPVLSAGSCPLGSESDLHPVLQRNDAMGQQATSMSEESITMRCREHANNWTEAACAGDIYWTRVAKPAQGLSVSRSVATVI